MTIQEKYHFDDFTLSNYQQLLRLAKQNYVFRSYTDFSKKEKFILWRHDIDFSPHQALKLAKIEHEESIKTLYCLQLHSIFYNIFEREITDIIQEIIKLGHQIGLHFEPEHYSLKDNVELLNKYLLREKRILDDIFNCEIDVFSFHNPTPLALKCDDWEYGMMINAYSKYFREEVGYCSDSNGYWRYRRLKNVLERAEDERLHVLTHPAWWQRHVMQPRLRIERCVNGRSNNTFKRYDKLLAKYGRENVK